MKIILTVCLLVMNFIAVQSFAQCNETHLLCRKQLSKEDKKAGWNVNKQSKSVSFEKGETYELIITGYEGLEYRLSVCTDIAGGTPAKFQLSQDIVTKSKSENGKVSIHKERQVIFDSSADNTDLYVLFRGSKTEKFYLSVTVPTAGKSKNKKLKDSDNVCVGVLLEHRNIEKSNF